MIIKPNETVADVVFKELKKEFDRLKEEFSNELGEFKDKIEFRLLSDLIELWIFNYKMYGPKEKFSVSEIKESIRTVLDDNKVTMMTTRTGFYTENGKSYIGSITIFIKEELFVNNIICGLNNIEGVIEQYKLFLRHEMGHIIANISRNGISVEEHVRYVEEHQKALDEFNEWLKDNPDKRDGEAHMKYYQLPSEAEANSAVGITSFDVERMNNKPSNGMAYEIRVLPNE